MVLDAPAFRVLSAGLDHSPVDDDDHFEGGNQALTVHILPLMTSLLEQGFARDQLPSIKDDMDDRRLSLDDRCTCVDRARSGRLVYDMTNQIIPARNAILGTRNASSSREAHKQEIVDMEVHCGLVKRVS
jgi:hypothetical protein